MKRLILTVAAVFAGLLVSVAAVTAQRGGHGGGHGGGFRPAGHGGHGFGHGGGGFHHGGYSHAGHGGNHGFTHHNAGSGHGHNGMGHGGYSGGKGGMGTSTKPGKGHTSKPGKGGKGMTSRPGKGGMSKAKHHPHHHHHHHSGPVYSGSGWVDGGSGWVDGGAGVTGGSGVVADGYVEGQGYGSDGVVGAQGGTRQNRRYLRVKNDTGEKLTVYVQYQTVSDSKGWTWYPMAPGSGTRAVAFTFAPGQEADLRHDDWPVNANCVRVWGRSASGEEFVEYRDEDLWLVDEQDGERVYYADEAETFTFTFSR